MTDKVAYMAYNLTENQKNVLRWMVEEVKAGRLDEEFAVAWFLGSEGAKILEYQGEPPVLTPGVLDALEAAGMIVNDIRYRTKTHTRGTSRNPRIEYTQSETSRRITLTGKAFEAVASNFRDPDDAPVTPDEFRDVTQADDTLGGIQNSLRQFREDHPDPARTAFILMQFGRGQAHEEIAAVIKEGLAAHGITGVRADDKQYHDDLFPNVLTYMHGCGLGIAVFERIEAERFNPNVALEVGYMFAMGKPVCLLKDQTLSTLHADLVGKLFHEFDTRNPIETIPPVVSKWLSDKKLPAARNETPVVEKVRSDLREAKPNNAKRRAIIGLIAEAYERGQQLERAYVHRNEGVEHEDLERWVDTVNNFISDAFGPMQAATFLSNHGVDLNEKRYLPGYELYNDPYLMEARFKRLEQLGAQALTLPIEDDFDPQKWEGRFDTHDAHAR